MRAASSWASVSRTFRWSRARRGHEYLKPVTTMRNYLAAMAAAKVDPAIRMDDRAIVLAALGPNMLALSRDATKGAHPYCVTPEHTAQAREILGPDGWLCRRAEDPAVDG